MLLNNKKYFIIDDIDFLPIAKEVKKWDGTTPIRPERIELRTTTDDHRHIIRAVFRYTDEQGDTSCTLSWKPSVDEYSLNLIEYADKASIIRILDRWKSMLNPDDFELIKEHLGVVDEARNAIKEVL